MYIQSLVHFSEEHNFLNVKLSFCMIFYILSILKNLWNKVYSSFFLNSLIEAIDYISIFISIILI